MESYLGLEGAAAALGFLPGWPAPESITIQWHTIGHFVGTRISIRLSRLCARMSTACSAMANVTHPALASQAWGCDLHAADDMAGNLQNVPFVQHLN